MFTIVNLMPGIGETQSKEFLSISPNGTVPAIKNDGLCLFER